MTAPVGDVPTPDELRATICRIVKDAINLGYVGPGVELAYRSIEATNAILRALSAQDPAAGAREAVKEGIELAARYHDDARAKVLAQTSPGHVTYRNAALGHETDAAMIRELAYDLRSSPPPFSPGPEFAFWYRNYRGETEYRRVCPIAIRFGSTDWHPEPQWLLRAFDVQRQAEREFAMSDIAPPPASAQVDAMRERCAAICDGYANIWDRSSSPDAPMRAGIAKSAALDIRALGRADAASTGGNDTDPTAVSPDEVERCFICDEPFKSGDMVLPDVNEGLGHRACFGDDRDGFCDLETGEPLPADEPLPTGFPWEPEPAASTGGAK